MRVFQKIRNFDAVFPSSAKRYHYNGGLSVTPETGMFHAHQKLGYVLDLPSGAKPLASSALTPCQAFRIGRNAYGFLFHMEVAQTIIEEIVKRFANEL